MISNIVDISNQKTVEKRDFFRIFIQGLLGAHIVKSSPLTYILPNIFKGSRI